METGLVFNIQKYSIHDGPGIRTTVFLKGCPLDCWWCHNPESQALEPQITVNENRCVRCGECRDVCPQREFSLERDWPYVDSEHCVRCGQCVTACAVAARDLVGRRMTVAEVLAEILKDQIFYGDSGGGLTLSGGEPLLQLAFARELFTACRAQDIHTALDTCGFGRQSDLLALAPLVDLFLYDLKLLDDLRHRQYTGVSNAVILANLQALGQVHSNIWIRVPIIPGVNDDAANIEGTAHLAASIPGVRQVNLLPYHELGMHKAQRLGQSSRMGAVRTPAPDDLERMAQVFRDAGLKVGIGGSGVGPVQNSRL